MNKNKKAVFSRLGFTLIELLTVIAIIGILAAILFPVVGKVRESAAKTAGKAQFSQWAQAFDLFRQEYGYYPAFGTANESDFLVNETTDPADYDGDRFYETLTGRVASGASRGERLGTNDEGYVAGNTRSASFYTFPESEIEDEGNKLVIRDHFGNGDIVVFFDLNQDGVIKFGGGGATEDYGTTSLPEVTSVKTDAKFTPTVGDGDDDHIPNDGVRASVIFYSGGYGDELFMSWR